MVKVSSGVRVAFPFMALLLTFLFSCTDYDHDIPDTGANRAGFERHFGFPPDDGVREVYYYADELGADELYQLGFIADRETIAAIESSLGLVPAEPPMDAWGLVREFPWFKKSDIETLPFSVSAEGTFSCRKVLWYDAFGRRAFYLEYSL